MSWKNFGYVCCLSCGFNFILFQVLFVHLKFGQRSVEVTPERIPTASHACMTCGILNLVIVVLAVCYLKGIIRFNPLHHVMRVLNMAGRHGPATGSARYRRFTDSFNDIESTPNTAMDFDQDSNLYNERKFNLYGINRPDVSQPPPPMPPLDDSMLVNRSISSNTNQDGASNPVDKNPPFEMIDLN